jgi:DNA-binding CsgD family transcriptional regulator
MARHSERNRSESCSRTTVLSPNTVRNHVSHIFAKQCFAYRAEAIVRARRPGLGEDHSNA